jgi:putative transposase
MIIAQLEATPEISLKIVHERLLLTLGTERAGRLRTLQHFVADYRRRNQAALCLIAQPQKWRNKFMAATGSRSEHISRSNELWEIDSTPTDVMLSGARHNLVVVIDVFTRRIMVLVSRTSSSRAVAELLRRAIARWGLPETIKMDNGKDYRSEHVQRGLESLGVKVRFCTPFCPQEKPHVEAANRHINHDLLPGLPGYVGHNVAVRKEIDDRTGRGRSVAQIAAHLDVEAFEQFIEQYWIGHNATHQHSALGKITPDAMRARCPAPIRTAAPEALHLFFEPVAGIHTVGKQHIRHAHGYYSAPELVAHTGQRVRIRVNDYCAGTIYVFDAQTDAFICAAIDPEKAGVSRRAHAAKIKAAQSAFNGDVRDAHRSRVTAYAPQRIAQEIVAGRFAAATGRPLGDNVLHLPVREIHQPTPQAQSIPRPNRGEAQLSAYEARLKGAKRFYFLCQIASDACAAGYDFNRLSLEQWADLQRLRTDPGLHSLMAALQRDGDVAANFELTHLLTLTNRRSA